MSEHEVRDDFEQVDADAVCENCGTVNPEDSLICKVCGNNLRDQRQRRIGAVTAQPSWGPGGFRIFTGVLTVLGILILLLAAYSVPNIESWLVDIQTIDEAVDLGQLWDLPGSEIYDALLLELEESPTPTGRLRETIDNPIDDVSYNGRYALLRQGGLTGIRVIGEANLRRAGDRVYFVAKLAWRHTEIRGYAMLEEGETSEAVRPIVRNTASVSIDFKHYQGFGYAEKQPDGGHACYGQSFYNDNAYFVSAYRLR